MNRGRRLKTENRGRGKYLIYSTLVVFLVMIATFIVTLVIYNNKLKNSNYSELTAEKIAQLVPNETDLALEQASTDIGKSIEEVIKQVEENNSVLQENIKQEEENKKIETKTLEETEEEEAVTTNVEPEKVKDPEFSMPVEGEITKSFAKDTLIYSETLQEWITHLRNRYKSTKDNSSKSLRRRNSCSN